MTTRPYHDSTPEARRRYLAERFIATGRIVPGFGYDEWVAADAADYQARHAALEANRLDAAPAWNPTPVGDYRRLPPPQRHRLPAAPVDWRTGVWVVGLMLVAFALGWLCGRVY